MRQKMVDFACAAFVAILVSVLCYSFITISDKVVGALVGAL